MTPPPFTGGKAQPSLLRMWQAKFKNSIKSYLKVKDDLDELMKTAFEIDEGGAYTEEGDLDRELTEAINRLQGKERLLRGVVRGGAGMVLILCRPEEAARTGRRYAEHIHDLEVDYGMPGVKHQVQVNYEGQVLKPLMEDNRDARR